MTIEETAEVLAYVSLFDNREVTEGMILAWHDVLPATVTKEQALTRVRDRIRRSDGYVQPSHLTAGPDEWMNR